MPGGLPEPRPGSSTLVPWLFCMLLRPSLFELVRSARLIRIKRGSRAPWDLAFLNSRTAASKRGHDVSCPYKECPARIGRASKANLHSGRGYKHGSEDPSLRGPCTTEVRP